MSLLIPLGLNKVYQIIIVARVCQSLDSARRQVVCHTGIARRPRFTQANEYECLASKQDTGGFPRNIDHTRFFDRFFGRECTFELEMTLLANPTSYILWIRLRPPTIALHSSTFCSLRADLIRDIALGSGRYSITIPGTGSVLRGNLNWGRKAKGR